MATVGIMTIFDMTNIGNRLQNYALARVLEQLGHDVTVLANHPYPAHDDPDFRDLAPEVPQGRGRAPRGSRVDNAFLALKSRIPSYVQVLPALVRAGRSGDRYAVRRAFAAGARRRELRRFTRESMTISSSTYRRPEDVSDLGRRFDYFVTGSDQVWNFTYRRGCPMDFLTFAEPHQRVAYAASIGQESLGAYEALFAAGLAEFDKISVRERQAAQIVKQVTGTEPPVVLDPTLLLTKEEWSALADRASPQASGPYVASYLLYRQEPETREAVRRSAEAEQLILHDMLAPVGGVRRRAGAEAFVRSIRDARYVVTDSFHATVFSLIFGVPVVALSRGGGQDERIMTLLRTIGLSPDAVFGSPDQVPTSPLTTKPAKLLEQARTASRSWLASATGQTPPDSVC